VVVQQGGVIATTRAPIRIGQYLPQYTDLRGHTYYDVVMASADASAVNWLDATPPVKNFVSTSSFPDTKICPGTEACVLIGLPENSDFEDVIGGEYLSTCENQALTAQNNIKLDTYPLVTFFPITAGPPTGSYAAFGSGGQLPNPAFGSAAHAAMIPSSDSDVALFGNFWYTRNCHALNWAGSGLPANQAYEFKATVCMELCVSHSAASPYRSFITPPAGRDERAIALVEEVVKQLPPSMPRPGSSSSWFNALTSAATGAADVLKELSIPFVSPAAGLFSKIFGKLTN